MLDPIVPYEHFNRLFPSPGEFAALKVGKMTGRLLQRGAIDGLDQTLDAHFNRSGGFFHAEEGGTVVAEVGLH